LKDLPRERILTIIVAPASKELANVVEQGLKVARQRITGSVQMPYHLVQEITKARQLRVNEPPCIVFWFALDKGSPVLIEQKRPPEMDRSHTDRACAPLDALKLACGEAEIELLVARFRFPWPSHDRCSLAERMRPGDLGATFPAPNENLLPKQKDISLPSPANSILSFSHLHCKLW
jgi:hypothetical protein